jgi:hypothetical protein
VIKSDPPSHVIRVYATDGNAILCDIAVEGTCPEAVEQAKSLRIHPSEVA